MRWFLYLPVMILFGISAKLLAPILPLFSVLRDGPTNNNGTNAVEPRLPKWLAFYDTDDNSLWGDQGHKDRVGDHEGYWAMVLWLIRNGGHGFNYKVIGCPALAMRAREPGEYYWTRPDGFWLYRRFIPFKTKTLELFFGWNLFGIVNGRCKYVCQVRIKSI